MTADETEYEIGDARPDNGARVETLTYIGPCERLQGKTALVVASGDHVAAQFDDVTTGHGFGWWLFIPEDFSPSNILAPQ